MGICIPIFFMAGDLNSIVFKSENSVGSEKITRYFAVRICLFNYFRRGRKLEHNFPLGDDILANFSSGRGSHRVCKKGVC